jgi:hypothetical protein
MHGVGDRTIVHDRGRERRSGKGGMERGWGGERGGKAQ